MPQDPLADGPSEASFAEAGDAFVLRYTWTHPDDGTQTDLLLVSAPDAAGAVEGTLFDTWHQQPGVMRLTGIRSGETVSPRGTYLEEWGWEVEVTRTPTGSTMTMRNVVPASALVDAPPELAAMGPGPYDVMVAAWGTSA